MRTNLTRHSTGIKKHKFLTEDQVIVLYKAGSFGEIVGIYESAKEIENIEKPFNQLFNTANVYAAVSKNGYFRSYHHQCKVKPVIRKRSEVKELIK